MHLRKLLACATVATLGLSTIAISTAHAQGPAGRPDGAAGAPGQRDGQQGRRQGGLVRALETLNLTAAQKAKINPLVAKYRTSVQGLRGMDPAQRGPKMMEISRKLRTDVEAVLTTEQKAKLAQEMQFGRILRDLNLTASQKTKMDPILKSAAAEMRKIQENTSLDRQAQRQKTRALMQSTIAKIRPLLTTEQKTKLEQAQQRRPGGNRNAAPGGNRSPSRSAGQGAARGA